MAAHEDPPLRHIVAVLGANRRRRHWLVAPRTSVYAVCGRVELDFREAEPEVAGTEIELEIVVVLGRATLVVPAGTEVELTGSSFLASVTSSIDDGPAPALPRIRINVTTVLGRARVLSPPGDEPAPGGAVPAAAAPATAPPPASALAVAATTAGRPAEAAVAPTPAAAGPQPPTARAAEPAPPPANLALPRPEDVRDLLAGLVGVGVKVRRAPPIEGSGGHAEAVASYVSDDGVVQAVCACDLQVGASLGSALALIPAHVAREAARQDQLPESIAENLAEVMNVSASLFNTTRDRHVKLRDVSLPRQDPPPDVAPLLAAPSHRLDLEVEVEGYGAGVLSLLVA